MTKYCLTIAASDTSGGAGIQRDLKVFHDNGVWGLSVITGITAQSFDKVFYANPLPKKEVEVQLKAVFENFRISSGKIGVIFNLEIMKLVTEYLIKNPIKNIIIDPIIFASDGTELLNSTDFDYFNDNFLKLADLITPNIPELVSLGQSQRLRGPERKRLSGNVVNIEQDIIKNAKFLSTKYDSFIFVKGGHLEDTVVKDFLVKDNFVKEFKSKRRKLLQSHGTGCAISSAITANLAIGFDIKDSIKNARRYFNKTFLP
jgi:hydroxymethylpyrimidine/phosphomethylpyrimidine kinase